MTALAVSDALLSALRAELGASGAYVAVPDNKLPPYAVIGQFVSEPAGGKGGASEWHLVDVHCWTSGNTRAPLQTMMGQVKAALDNVTLTGAGIAPFMPMMQPGATDELHEDGITWSSTQRFKILGQTAA